MIDTNEMTKNVRSLKSSRLHAVANAAGIYAVVVILIVIGCIISREFLSPNNALNAIRSVALLGIVAVGVAFVTYSGHYADLSVPSIMALSGIAAISAMQDGLVASFAAAIAAGLAVGLINGLAVGYLRVNPIIWTLAMGSIMACTFRKVFLL